MTSSPCYVMANPRQPWFVTIKIAYDEAITKFCWQFPGVRWDKQRALWNVPVEVADDVLAFVRMRRQQLGQSEPEVLTSWAKPEFPEKAFFADPTHAREIAKRVPMWERTRDYQRRHAWAAAAMDRWIEGSEMGLGKAVIAMLCEQLRGSKTGIVVDTAGHRADWFNERRRRKDLIDDEFGRWWPGHPEIDAIETRFDARNSKAAIKVVSYNLLPDLVRAFETGGDGEIPLVSDGNYKPSTAIEYPKQPDFVWFDEAHMLQNPDVVWSIAARKLIHEIAPKAHVLAMTGTLVPDNVMTVLNVIDTIWPGRMGTKYDFGKVYSEVHTNDFGKSEYWGVNPENVPNFRRRLEWMSLRTVKSEVAHMLPPFDVRPRWIDDGSRDSRVAEVKFWAEECFGNGAHHVTAVCHLRATADAMVDALSGLGIEVVKLTGALTPTQRAAEIRRAKDLQKCIIVATLHAITTGVNLSFSPEVCFAEIYPRVVDMVQVLGRFHRMTSTEPTNIKVLAALGGDPIAELLMNKLRAVNQIMKPGVAEGQLDNALEELRSGGLTQDAIDALLQGNAGTASFDEFS